jgi:CRP-like cAMP-binding protein
VCVPPPPDLRANRLLRDLPPAEDALLDPHLTLTSLVPHQQLYDAGEPIKALWFPVDSMISQVAVFAGRAMVEVNTVGRDGLAGLPVVLGVDSTPHAALCQVAGRAIEFPADAVAEVLPAAPELQRRIALYSHVSMVQLGQNAACLGRHPAPRRAARWLLTTADRTGRERVELTQDFFAQMLGVRRATVSEIARDLQDAGLISYRRGVITTIDRAGLADRACSCYPLLLAQDQLINAL